MGSSKLGSALGALAAAVFGAWSVAQHVNPKITVMIIGVVGAVASLLNPALAAKLDEVKAMPASWVGTIVGFLIDALVLHFNLSPTVQAAVVGIITALQGLFLPAVHLQQATLYRPPVTADSRPVTGPTTTEPPHTRRV